MLHNESSDSDSKSSQTPPNRMFQRLLGDSELSYFLPSREDGVNDMYLHLSLKAPNTVVNPYRLVLVWAILRIRHPLLASRVLAAPGKYEGVSFQYHPPSSPSEALLDASSALEIRQGTAEALILAFLNGLRTLSNNRLSYLILSYPNFNGLPTVPHTPASGVEPESLQEFDLLICATHFLGDGMALHMFANDLFSLLAPSEKRMDDSELYKLLIEVWRTYWGESSEVSLVEHVLPPALESQLPKPSSAFQRIARKLEFDASQDRVLGSHMFPHQGTDEKPKRHTIVQTTSFDRQETKKILARCKKENVSIGHLLFAVCNATWIKIGKPDQRLPMMMYSALNLRPYLPLPSDKRHSPVPSLSDSYWFLAVGYFNVVLPSFPARSVYQRARLVKGQCIAASKNRLLLSRTRCMAHERSVKAKKFAAIDDEAKMEAPPEDPLLTLMVKSDTRSTKSPSIALLGLSLLGNLDGIYRHDAYPSIILDTLTTGSRQRPGGLLVFGYTFSGKLWLSIGYDKGAYNDQVALWWDEVAREMKEIVVTSVTSE